MQKRKVPKNSTPVLHTILEALSCAKLSNSEFNIVCAVIRQTYGWQKKTAWISGELFEKLTGIRKRNCYRAISSLVKKRILTKNGKSIGINKNTDEWDNKREVCIDSRLIQNEGGSNEQNVSGLIHKCIQIDTKNVSRLTPIKEKKENNKINKTSLEVLREKKEAVKLAHELLTRILQNNPKFKYSKSSLRAWVLEIDRMLRLDNRTFEEILQVIIFAQTDDFWQSNILSAKKLRLQFDQLWVKMSKRGHRKIERIEQEEAIPDEIKDFIS